MKRKILLGLVLAGGMLFTPTAFGQETAHHHQDQELSHDYDWTLMKTEDGVEISYAAVETNGQAYLKIQLNNTTNRFIEVIWSLQKGGEEIINETANQLWENAALIHDQTLLIPVEAGDQLSDFVLTVKKINVL